MSDAAADGSLARCRAVTGRYYSGLVEAHGPTPLGVDWTCVPTQELRFVQLLKLRGAKRKFSLNDLGCGYGALVAYLDRWLPHCAIDYLGVDLSPAMVAQARALWAQRPKTAFSVGHVSPREADFSVASGIFNVRLDLPQEDWTGFVADTLDGLHATSRLGFAVNFLEPVAAGTRARPELYRAPREAWARYCEQRFASRVEIVSGYGMREYTLLVRSASGDA